MVKIIHIGELIENRLKKNGQTKVWLAKQLGCEYNNIYRLLKRPSLDSFLLSRISKILEFNFFDYYFENQQ